MNSDAVESGLRKVTASGKKRAVSDMNSDAVESGLRKVTALRSDMNSDAVESGLRSEKLQRYAQT
jgi:hypothetical protein